MATNDNNEGPILRLRHKAEYNPGVTLNLVHNANYHPNQAHITMTHLQGSAHTRARGNSRFADGVPEYCPNHCAGPFREFIDENGIPKWECMSCHDIFD